MVLISIRNQPLTHYCICNTTNWIGLKHLFSEENQDYKFNGYLKKMEQFNVFSIFPESTSINDELPSILINRPFIFRVLG